MSVTPPHPLPPPPPHIGVPQHADGNDDVVKPVAVQASPVLSAWTEYPADTFIRRWKSAIQTMRTASTQWRASMIEMYTQHADVTAISTAELQEHIPPLHLLDDVLSKSTLRPLETLNALSVRAHEDTQEYVGVCQDLLYDMTSPSEEDAQHPYTASPMITKLCTQAVQDMLHHIDRQIAQTIEFVTRMTALLYHGVYQHMCRVHHALMHLPSAVTEQCASLHGHMADTGAISTTSTRMGIFASAMTSSVLSDVEIHVQKVTTALDECAAQFPMDDWSREYMAHRTLTLHSTKQNEKRLLQWWAIVKQTMHTLHHMTESSSHASVPSTSHSMSMASVPTMNPYLESLRARELAIVKESKVDFNALRVVQKSIRDCEQLVSKQTLVSQNPLQQAHAENHSHIRKCVHVYQMFESTISKAMETLKSQCDLRSDSESILLMERQRVVLRLTADTIQPFLDACDNAIHSITSLTEQWSKQFDAAQETDDANSGALWNAIERIAAEPMHLYNTHTFTHAFTNARTHAFQYLQFAVSKHLAFSWSHILHYSSGGSSSSTTHTTTTTTGSIGTGGVVVRM